ncbi:methylmalonyl-CoA mutase cobalamin-binding subunit [Saccharothrix ecbatanensis]|uniref:Methylmalonyl-CoA mutase cobalamin-binding subunit n=1 Tax=Saccharothrix ecbatanensis TaxID=1105145 RepID=A0A7W9HFR2_9PSEU|nr:cobalamin-dependent protein [Saccharothrix ecbatanensis]MBB5801410.1 methylmalonyl-CoA mutase cobalamin-binding subunit [Saccharothrix ecbatanensis]
MSNAPTALAVRPVRVVLSSVFSDAHTWNLVFLQLLLEEHGCLVTNLGACVPEELLLEHCRDHRPDLVVISTVNGHGHLDGVRLARLLRADPDTADLRLVIGGKLGVGGGAESRHALIAAGFDMVVEDSDPQRLVGYVEGLRRPALPSGRTTS